MIYTEMTIAAMGIAYRAHHGQLDKRGVPYIFHPIHLAEQMDDELSCTVALLHDVVEDTPITLEQLRMLFPAQVTDALALLTHDDTQDYFDYVRAIRTNPLARKVKLADLAHNRDATRFAGMDINWARREKQQAKYETATKILMEI